LTDGIDYGIEDERHRACPHNERAWFCDGPPMLMCVDCGAILDDGYRDMPIVSATCSNTTEYITLQISGP